MKHEPGLVVVYRRRAGKRNYVKSISSWEWKGNWYCKLHYTFNPFEAKPITRHRWNTIYSQLPRGEGVTMYSHKLIGAAFMLDLSDLTHLPLSQSGDRVNPAV